MNSIQKSLSAIAALAMLAHPGLSQSVLEIFDLEPAKIALSSNPNGAQVPYKQYQTPMPELAGEFYFTASTPTTGRALFKTSQASGDIQFVYDFYQGPGSADFGEMVVVNGRLYVVTNSTNNYSRQLWSTTGTPASTMMEFDPAVFGVYDPKELTPVGSKLYFTTLTGFGRELVVYDTTPGATPLVISVHSVGFNPAIRNVIAHPSGTGVLFEVGNQATGHEIWTSDGTQGGTHMLLDLKPGPESGKFADPIGLGAVVVFSGATVGRGREPYYTDGTAAGTGLLMDINPGTGSSEPAFYPRSTEAGVTYFTAENPAMGRELYRTDGTMAGTYLVLDGLPGPESSSLEPIGFAGSTLVVSANLVAASDMQELYALGAGGLVLLKDFDVAYPGSAGYTKFTTSASAGGRLLLSSWVGLGLWITDGTPGGTTLLRSFEAIPASLTAISATDFLFAGKDSIIGKELFRTGGTTQTTLAVKDLFPGATPISSYPAGLHSANGRDLYLYRKAKDSNDQIAMHWREGTGFEDLSTVDYVNPQGNVWIGDHAEFILEFSTVVDSTAIPQLYRTDGTAAGTHKIQDQSGLLKHGQWVLGSDGIQTYFVGGAQGFGRELWATDGTDAGTYRVKDIRPGPGHSMFMPQYDRPPVIVGGKVLFLASDGVSSGALWGTDGTAVGTELIVASLPGGFSSIEEWIELQGKLIFSAYSTAAGQELWISDGTPQGSGLLKDLAPGILGSNPTGFAELDGLVYFFVADDASDKVSIWSTDGTSLGTQKVLDTPDNPWPLNYYKFVPAGDKLFFSYRDASHGNELWAFDGTSAALVKDLMPGTFTSYPSRITACGDRVYFSAETPGIGQELWVSDGTAAGTILAADINTGSGDSNPSDLTLCNGDLFFSAESRTGDRELFRLTEPGPHVLDLGFGASGSALTSTSPTLGSSISITIAKAPVGKVSALLMSGPVDANSAFANFGNASWIDPLTFNVVAFSTATSWSVTKSIPSSPAFIGLEVNIQTWFLDPVTSGLETSNGLRLVFGF